ncbi:methyltransferase family protein [Candidatus Neomarinimicrobiota bacterium]
MTTNEDHPQGTSAAAKGATIGLLHRLGNFLFRNRSYTPVPLAIVLVWLAEVNLPSAIVGLVLVFGGELLRLTAVRSFGRGVRTRQVGAHQLVTWGLYAYTRNPLYLGNLLLWVGVVVFASGRAMPWMLGTVLIFFLLQYTLIISLEEAKLRDLFGESYRRYCQAVPRVFPRIRRKQDSVQTEKATLKIWRYAFRHERSTLWAIAAILLLTLLSSYLKA